MKKLLLISALACGMAIADQNGQGENQNGQGQNQQRQNHKGGDPTVPEPAGAAVIALAVFGGTALIIRRKTRE